MLVAVRTIFAFVLIGCLLLSVAVWTLPIEFAQSQASIRYSSDKYAQFDAVGRVEAIWWMLRILMPALGVVSAAGLYSGRRFFVFAGRAIHGFLRTTAPFAANTDRESDRRERKFVKTILVRATVMLWLVLGAGHLGASVWQRIVDWPYYRLNRGRDVLPNMSFSNRDVFGYLKRATPPGSKILVLSDQKPYFLSYYLLPRRLYHPMHPESEFVIPLAHGGRQLAAYQLKDLSDEDLNECRPDYILEYFEGKAYVERERLMEDPQWMAFVRERAGSEFVLDYQVILHRVPERQP